MNDNIEPVWKRPGWLTAIVGLVTALLTIPDVVGNYLSKQQDIETRRLENLATKQETNFRVINNIIAKQGAERIFILRYMAATLDDEDAKVWAYEEVQRLDNLAKIREELVKTERKLEISNQKLAALQFVNDSESLKLKIEKEIAALDAVLVAKKSELNTSKYSTGLVAAKEWFNDISASIPKLKLRKLHEQVKVIISDWNKITDSNKNSETVKYLTANVAGLLEEYGSFDHSEWDIRLRVVYLSHLVSLQVIYTDVYREPTEIFNAVKNITFLEYTLNDQILLAEDDIEYFSRIGMTSRLEWQALNVKVFAYLSTNNDKFRQEAKVILKVLGGCDFLVSKGVTHKDIYYTLDCEIK